MHVSSADAEQVVFYNLTSKINVDGEVPAYRGSYSTEREMWTDFETAFEYAESDEADGLGFVFSEDDSFVGIDLDDCRDPETSSIDDDARDIVNRLDSYTGISPSGTGFRVLIKGSCRRVGTDTQASRCTTRRGLHHDG